jgi:hypothetical protein
MVTIDQVKTAKYFVQTARTSSGTDKYDTILDLNTVTERVQLYKTIVWRANGKCKTWITRPEEFKLPIKYGLYTYGYLTNANAHLFEIHP